MKLKTAVVLHFKIYFVYTANALFKKQLKIIIKKNWWWFVMLASYYPSIPGGAGYPISFCLYVILK